MYYLLDLKQKQAKWISEDSAMSVAWVKSINHINACPLKEEEDAIYKHGIIYIMTHLKLIGLNVDGFRDFTLDKDILHKGISQRSFIRSFALADDMVVKDAKMDNGLLSINIEKIVPDEKKPKTVSIK